MSTPTESSTVRAVVRALDATQAVVEVESGGCGRCHEEGGCGGQNLTQMFCAGPKTYRVDNAIGASVGDRVTVAIAPGSVRRVANLAYGVPLTATIAGAALGAQYGDVGSMLGAVSALLLAVLYVRFCSRDGAGNYAARPHIISRS
ncbi:SoxR reducing system RseC family protein [Dechloromonas denitrificans]|uniref:SoxR reducing system RseC family protein n=1 Tax=Dechloromonas denitrificans TaxID=281362 RepID=UPI001CF86ABA|nr:SoxR reducing system RseC family protein [Dechloromonas denitrificans]UCV13114.1 SoxR reducing system RseC family protein [Dechloromonas denitrificans]